jgi:hypothetical protein
VHYENLSARLGITVAYSQGAEIESTVNTSNDVRERQLTGRADTADILGTHREANVVTNPEANPVRQLDNHSAARLPYPGKPRLQGRSDGFASVRVSFARLGVAKRTLSQTRTLQDLQQSD